MNDELDRREASVGASALIKLHGQVQRVARGAAARNHGGADEGVGRESRLSAREPGQDGGPKAKRDGTRPGETADHHNEECVVTAVVGLTMRAAGEMPANGGGLFRD